MKPTKFLALVLALFLLTAVFIACGEDPVDTDFNDKQTIIDNEQTDIEQEQIDVIEKNTDTNEMKTNESENLFEESTNIESETDKESANIESETDKESANIESETDEAAKYEISTIGDFHDGLALIKANTGYGYINTKGEIVIEPCFDMAYEFEYGIACVVRSNQYGYINTSGEYIVKPQYTNASNYFHKIAKVDKNGVSQYINEEGDVIYTVTGKEVEIGEISNGSFWVETVEELISGNLHTIARCEYEGKNYFAVVLESESKVRFTSLIDESGKVLIAPTREYVFVNEKQEYSHGYNYIYTMTPIVDGIIRVKDVKSGLYGYVDINGNWIIEPTYTSAFDFFDYDFDVVAVVNNNTIIDRNGNIIFSIASDDK